MRKFNWNDGMRNRSRDPYLFVIKGTEIVRFVGKGVEGKLGVVESKFNKNGKWSNTEYSLAISDDCIAVQLLRPFDGWGETLEDLKRGFSRVDLAEKLNLSDDLVIEVITNNFSEDGPLRNKLKNALENREILNSLK